MITTRYDDKQQQRRKAIIKYFLSRHNGGRRVAQPHFAAATPATTFTAGHTPRQITFRRAMSNAIATPGLTGRELVPTPPPAERAGA